MKTPTLKELLPLVITLSTGLACAAIGGWLLSWTGAHSTLIGMTGLVAGSVGTAIASRKDNA